MKESSEKIVRDEKLLTVFFSLKECKSYRISNNINRRWGYNILLHKDDIDLKLWHIFL
jgi:hypothetical protein